MILVVGATGSLGGRIVHGLLEQGREVRVLVRHNPISAAMAEQGLAHTPESLIEAGAQPVWGDLKDRASLDAAVGDVDTVITTANAVKRGGEDTIESVDLQGTLNLIDAARRAGVKRFLYTSVQDPTPDSPDRLFQIKSACQEALQESGMNYTFIQPSIFMEVWIGMVVGIPLMTGQPIILIGRGDHAHNFISEQEVADYFIAAVDNPQAYHKVIKVGGPASHTWTEIVERVGSKMGAQLPVEYLPLGSDNPYIPPAANSLVNYMEMFEDEMDSSELANTFGVRPTSLDEFIDRTFVRR
jgi:NADH dehydrogenase